MELPIEPPLTLVTAPSPCEYLPARDWQMQCEIVGEIHPREYLERLRQGWRRFGEVFFRPACPSCCMCQSLRVPVVSFKPSRSQRRVWRANVDTVTTRVGVPSITPGKRDLYVRFHCHQEKTKGWPSQDPDGIRLFVDTPFPTEEWCYFLGDRLVAVGYVDAVPEGLSAVYFYYDPAHRHRSLGTFNVLSLLAEARARNLPHVYLGYYVEGCRSLEYKGRFRPNEMFDANVGWTT